MAEETDSSVWTMNQGGGLAFPHIHKDFNFTAGEEWERHVEKFRLHAVKLKLETTCMEVHNLTCRQPGPQERQTYI
jgi:hypothetical protein